MAGDRHAGVKRCLHPQARREFISTGDFGRQRERERRLKTTRRVGQQEFQSVCWGPWVSAGAQVKQALLAQGSSEGVASLSFREWVDLCKKP